MRLPQTSAPNYMSIDASRNSIAFNQFAYPALKVQSIINMPTGFSLIQGTSALQPTWADNAIAGTYSARNNPGVLTSTPAGQPGMIFAGGQYFNHDYPSSLFAGAEIPLTLVFLVSGSTSGAICSFASSTSATPKLTLSVSGGNISFAETNGNGTYTASGAMDNKVHCVTAIRANNTLTIRVDGAQLATAAITAGTEAFSTFTIGAVNSNGTVGTQFTGTIGFGALYGGSADIYQVETYLQLKYGVIRSASSGINTGF